MPLRLPLRAVMGKKKSNTPAENWLLLPKPPSAAPIVDTHTHLASTFEFYRQRYKQGKYETVFDFMRGLYSGRNVDSIIDVWCEAPVRKIWREFADSAQEDRWDGINYWFVMGVHPHEAKHYTDEVEAEIVEAMSHPRCVGWGEMGLDYHYDLSPRDVQQSVFRRQLKLAVKLNKPLTIHTREADGDTERILKEEVPKEHPIHIHCFTDTPQFASNLLSYFPNLYIGITGVITYASNVSTSQVVQNLLASVSPATSQLPSPLRILLETDAPYMIPANLYSSLPATLDGESLKGRKLPLCHTTMIPWVAEFVANVANGNNAGEGVGDERENEDVSVLDKQNDGKGEVTWTADSVMRIARDNARRVYGI